MLLRKQAGKSQREVGAALGVTYQTVSDWERGKYVPHLSPAKMLLYCQLLNCSLEDLAERFPESEVNAS